MTTVNGTMKTDRPERYAKQLVNTGPSVAR